MKYAYRRFIPINSRLLSRYEPDGLFTYAPVEGGGSRTYWREL